MTLAAVNLDDKYTLESGRIYLTGTQALVRLPLMQRQRDTAAGLHTGCFISGYRGSPLGQFDMELWKARRFLERNHIRLQPGVNEDLAATAVWGSQQVKLLGQSDFDGVFGIWYGKGPGVDRTGDAFRHANLAGTAPHGGVLALLGDDHMAKSSTTAHQSEYAMVDAMIPVLNPAGVQEFLDFGLYGWAMSRFAGCWVGFKCVTQTVDSSASVIVDPHRIDIVVPEDFAMPPGGLHIRWPEDFLAQEERLHRYKIPAVREFARLNKLDRIVFDSPKARLGIITAGKSYLDVRQALADLGIDEKKAADLGIRLYKPTMTWPLEPEGLRRFAQGLEEILVVEEKRPLIEDQVKELLFNEQTRPARVIGKKDETGEMLLPSNGELMPDGIAFVIADRIGRFHRDESIADRVAYLRRKGLFVAEVKPSDVKRTPYFCAGCPHNTSTRLPDGSIGMAGIGCHWMALNMNRNTYTYTHMGGEGANWAGAAPFSKRKHMFQNVGDGTYFHSGFLAIRSAVAAGVNITYKILYNDAVAMTGGQPVDGHHTVAQISHQLHGEGVGKIVVVSDEPNKYPIGADFAAGVTIRHRSELDAVQREMRDWPGVSAIIYDQTCATEKRRRRKRGKMVDPAKRVFINDAVCEGCGDCSAKSNCVAVVPVETEYGRKRAIDQSSCNKDYSCLNGFCPSFVTIEGGGLRKAAPQGVKVVSGAAVKLETLPEPTLPSITSPYAILVTGIGGTGVVTIGALIGMAAHLEGKGCSVLDMTGLAQKGGPVLSHLRIAEKADDIHTVAIGTGGADLVLGCDLVVAAGKDALSKVDHGHTRAVVNSHETPVAGFIHNPDLAVNGEEMQALIEETAGKGNARFVEATRLATALFGDSIATNMFMLGFAYQQGLIPVSSEALEKAIDLNGVAVSMNKRAFAWGRLAAHDQKAVEDEAAPRIVENPAAVMSKSLDEVIARRMEFLTAYQDRAYAERYLALVARARDAEKTKAKGRSGFAEAVARYYFKLLAYKDEYEVARLHSDKDFRKKIRETFDGDYKVRFHMAPPLIAPRDPQTGELKKMSFGPWMMGMFVVLAGFKSLRGTKLDIFGYSAERKMERQLITDYETVVEELIEKLDTDNHAVAVQIAEIPEHIRGYGHVKDRHLAEAKAQEARLLDAFRAPPQQAAAAE